MYFSNNPSISFNTPLSKLLTQYNKSLLCITFALMRQDSTQSGNFEIINISSDLLSVDKLYSRFMLCPRVFKCWKDSREVTLFMFIYGHIKDQCKKFHDPLTSSFINQLRTLWRRVLSMFIFNCMQIGSPLYSNSV